MNNFVHTWTKKETVEILFSPHFKWLILFDECLQGRQAAQGQLQGGRLWNERLLVILCPWGPSWEIWYCFSARGKVAWKWCPARWTWLTPTTTLSHAWPLPLRASHIICPEFSSSSVHASNNPYTKSNFKWIKMLSHGWNSFGKKVWKAKEVNVSISLESEDGVTRLFLVFTFIFLY